MNFCVPNYSLQINLIFVGEGDTQKLIGQYSLQETNFMNMQIWCTVILESTMVTVLYCCNGEIAYFKSLHIPIAAISALFRLAV